MNIRELELATAAENLQSGDISHERRNLLKGVTGLAAMASLPVVGASVIPQAKVITQALQDSTLEMEFIDSKSIDGFVALGQATLVNRSAQDLLLTDFAPALLTTANASYDLAAHLKLAPLSVAAGQRLRFWVKPVTTTDQYGFTCLVAVPESGITSASQEIAGPSSAKPFLARLDLTVNSPSARVDAIRQPVAITVEYPDRPVV